MLTGLAKVPSPAWTNTWNPAESGTTRSSRPSPFTSRVMSTWGTSRGRGDSKSDGTATSSSSVPCFGSSQLRRPGS